VGRTCRIPVDDYDEEEDDNEGGEDPLPPHHFGGAARVETRTCVCLCIREALKGLVLFLNHYRAELSVFIFAERPDRSPLPPGPQGAPASGSSRGVRTSCGCTAPSCGGARVHPRPLVGFHFV